MLLTACDTPKPPAGDAPSATASTQAAPVATATKPKGMPELLVDELGPYLGGRRVDMKQQDATEKLIKIIKELPIEGKPVTLLADRKAKTPIVAAVVYELGAAGAPKVIIKTDGRDDLPKEIEVTPEPRVTAPTTCAVTTMVLEDLSTAVWPFKGGLGKRQRKGLAGPDLSHTGETLEKEIAGCNGTVAFFSGDDTIAWEMTHNIAGTLLQADKKKKIESLVLLHHAPVAGRPVKLGSGS
ncbi:Hypothetical protein CAP_7412 [Chondromyces apiculatus DSM 436]|uniref:Uncharacterized protein n=1 Tax=Chondromyces apiculatus DSM 436 TaxID=1192034 RepID=A0A017T0X1_9BACT|nr:Hypothetical protein CAP_7412 [Chondromyces apiculatus DSM 436]